MNIAGRTRSQLNRILEPANVRVETLTADRAELARLQGLRAAGHFDHPILPVLPQFERFDPGPVWSSIARVRDDLVRLGTAPLEDAYAFDNDYFTSSDAEVAYALVREFRPARIVEVGSGNSTLLFREAIRDGDIQTELVAIDPDPRRAVERVADRVIAKRLEEVASSCLLDALGANDILVIDSSHEVKAGNDVIRLLLDIVPQLKSDVLIHVHDIFLPFEYPSEWLIDNRWTWNEQYIVQALLQGSRQFDVVWPGHYLQRTLPDFDGHFVTPRRSVASSLWLRKVA
jgi:hypothetical protein